MRNKGVVISLAAMVLIGTMITKGTYNFIEKNSGGSTAQVTAAALDGAGEALVQAAPLGAEEAGQEPAFDMGEAGEGSPGDLEEGVKEKDHMPGPMADSGEGVKEDAAVLAEGAMAQALSLEEQETQAERSLLDTGKTSGEQPLEMEAGEEDWDSQSYYVKRLDDLDSQIKKSREKQPEANVHSSVKSAASNELKLWDSELNDIYNGILKTLDKEESQALVKEEREWLKERDVLAMEAALNSTGGSSESIEYTLSLIESTRARAYELARRYGQALGEQSGQEGMD